MGVDVAVCFCERMPSPDEIRDAVVASGARTRNVFVATGTGTDETAGKGHFALWADGSVDLRAVCAAVSAKELSAVYVAWKSEHGGVGGYLEFDSGREVEDVASDGEDYLLLPSRGFARAFRAPLRLAEKQLVFFPETVIDGGNTIDQYDLLSGQHTHLTRDFVKKLLEGDVDAEMVLPIEE